MNVKTEIKIMPGAIVCEETSLKGDITIATGCVIHPSATILAEAGPIIIGENCIIEEYAKILYRASPTTELSKQQVLLIGPNNVFEVGCVIEATKIGEKNVFECKCYVSAEVSVSNGCIIGAGTQLIGKQHLTENTVVYGNKCLQREALEKQGSHIVQLDFLRKVLPNYHHLKKPSFDPKKIRDQI